MRDRFERLRTAVSRYRSKHPNRVSGIFYASVSFALLAVLIVSAFGFNNTRPLSEGPTKPDPKTQAEKAGAVAGDLSYGGVDQAIRSGKVSAATIDPFNGTMRLEFKDDSTADVGIPADSADRLANQLDAHDATVNVSSLSEAAEEAPSSGGGIGNVIGIVFTVLLVGVLIFVIVSAFRNRGAMGGGMGGGMGAGSRLRKDAELDDASTPSVSFSDIAGCDEAVEEVQEFLTFLRSPERFSALGARIPSGLLLYGPPGTGKTLLGKALAGEAKLPFFYVSGSEFVNMYVGVGASNVRNLFARARKSEEGAVIFIDELDAVGGKRSGGDAGGNREADQTLNQLLVELDGFNQRERIVVMGATNRLDSLDPALLRPGRLSRQIQVSLPGEKGRREILELHSRGKPLAADVDLDSLAKITAGSSGADLADMVNEAAIMAARAGHDQITRADLEEGHLRALAGPERSEELLSPEEKRTVAFHEAGHALCAELCVTHEKAQRVTIKSRGQAAGLAVYGRQDRFLHSIEYLQEQLICILGGRAAERVVFKTVSSGAANDLQKANAIARQAVEEWGFSERAGQLVHRSIGAQASETTRSLHDEEVEALVANAYSEAVEMMESHRAQLDSLAEALLEQGALDRVDIITAIGGEIVARSPEPGRLGPSRDPVLSKPLIESPAAKAKRPRSRGLLPAPVGALLRRGGRRSGASAASKR